MKAFKVTVKGEETKTVQRSKKGRNSRNKGASFEREVAKLLEFFLGVEFIRTPLSGGFAKKKDKSEGFRGDVVPVDKNVNFLLHVEAKNAKTWSFPSWIKQAESDTPKGKIPVIIAHKFGTSKKYILLDVEDFFNLVPVERLIEREVNK